MNNAKISGEISANDSVRVSVITDIADAVAMVDTISQDALFAGHQHPNFIKAWLTKGKIDPAFIVLSAEGYGNVLLPLELIAGGTARYIGGKHAYGNFPMGKPADIQALGSNVLDLLEANPSLKELGINALALERQYEAWRGVKNPFVTDTSVTSPNIALSFSLDGGFDAVVDRSGGSKRRKKFRNLIRKMEALGEVQMITPVNLTEAEDTLKMFFELKAAHFRQQGISDSFGDQATRDAFLDMFTKTHDGGAASHELHALKINDDYAAIAACTIHDGRLTVEFGTYHPDYAHAGPGEQLYFRLIESATNRGLKEFDFGIGDERYKRSWCDVETWHKDTFVAVSTKGKLTRIAKQMRSTAVRSLKSNEQIWKTAKAARRKLGSLRA